MKITKIKKSRLKELRDEATKLLARWPLAAFNEPLRSRIVTMAPGFHLRWTLERVNFTESNGATLKVEPLGTIILPPTIEPISDPMQCRCRVVFAGRH